MKYTLEARVSTETLGKHCICIGASGSGKSLEITAMARSIINATNSAAKAASIVVIDPHADVCHKLMSLREVNTERLVYISTTIQREADCPDITPIFNPFQLPEDADETFKNLLAAQLTSTLAEMVDTTQYGITVNMHMLLLPAILVTLSSANPCMDTLKKLLDGKDASLLRIGLEYPHPQIQDFFHHHWNTKDYDLTKRALISKINYLLNDISLYNLLNGKGPDLDQCLESGKIIIVNAPIGANPFASNIIGRLMIAYIFSLMLRRENKQKKNVPCYMFIDELQSYASSTSLNDALRQSRKFGLRLILSVQSLKSLPAQLKSSIVTNCFLKMVSIADSETRSLMSREMNCSADELAKIEPLQFMVARNDGGKTTPFRVKVPILSKHLFLNPQEIKQRLNRLIQHSGVYQKVPSPPAPPATPPDASVQSKKEKEKNKAPDSPFDGLAPGFT